MDAASAAVRLRRARDVAGYPSAKGFARAIGVNETTYSHHEMGRRRLGVSAARLYARALGVKASFLLYGNEQLQPYTDARIVGSVGSDGIVHLLARNEKKEMLRIPFDLGHRLDAMTIAGDDLYPAYRDGDAVLFRPLSRDYDRAAVHDVECVVRLANGDVLLRLVTIQANGLATLTAYGGTTRRNALLIEASPVEYVRRRAAAA